MKRMFSALFLVVFAAVLCVSCAAGPAPAPKWQSSFPSVPLAERVGGEWTIGPVNK